MDVSKILKEVILLERGVKKMYEEIARDKVKDNVEIAKVLGILARESEDHAKELESRYGIFVKAETVNVGVNSLLSVLSESMAKLKMITKPVEVLHEGIKIEGYMEQLYKGLADNYETEENLERFILEIEEKSLKPSELFRKIAADEREHQQMLQRLTP
jgi:bacterioferritin (cytochrome b1)